MNVLTWPGSSGSAGVELRSGDEAKIIPGRKLPARGETKERDMGSALRTVYQRTVEETVPQEMLDLLGKLG